MRAFWRSSTTCSIGVARLAHPTSSPWHGRSSSSGGPIGVPANAASPPSYLEPLPDRGNARAARGPRARTSGGAARRSSPAPTASRCTRSRPSGCSSLRVASKSGTAPLRRSATSQLWRSPIPSSRSIRVRLDGLEAGDRGCDLDAAGARTDVHVRRAGCPGGRRSPPQAGLRRLVRREVLLHRSRSPVSRTRAYAFVQALIREVAYNTLS